MRRCQRAHESRPGAPRETPNGVREMCAGRSPLDVSDVSSATRALGIFSARSVECDSYPIWR
jgi:hypothetical protein